MGGPDITAELVRFATVLRAGGIAADTTRVTTALAALAELDPFDVEQVYWAGRLTLCGEPDDVLRYDQMFQAWFGDRRPAREQPATTAEPVSLLAPGSEPTAPGPGDGDHSEVVAVRASDVELLRHRDLVRLAAAEREEVRRLIQVLAPRTNRRRTLRRMPGPGRHLDLGATVRRMLADGGEPGQLVSARLRVKPRRLVLLVDVSGSMSGYADALLRFGHAAVRVAPATTEVFTLGTRLTRITRQLRLRDPELALRAAGAAIPDWSGGTRLGEALKAFLDLWGQRGTARRSVVVVFSDGWERGDAALLGTQMRRLRRLAHHVVWVHPHRDKDGFAPATAGMVAALPHVDDLVAGHSVAALTMLAEVIAHA